MISHQIEIKAPFFDVDSCQVVWHGHYLKYFEEARCALLDAIGYNYQAMREDGYLFPVVDLRIRYVKPLVFAQEFLVTSTLVEWENRLRIRYMVSAKETGEKITTAETTQVAVAVTTGVMQFETPAKMIRRVQSAMDAQNIDQ